MPKRTPLTFPATDEGQSGTISAWLVSEGETVRSGQSLVEVDVDKVSSELEAPHDGVLLEIVRAEGAELNTGEVLAWIAEADAARDVALHSLQVRIHAPCPGCGCQVAINGPWQHVTCSRCGYRAAISTAFWAEVFGQLARGQRHSSIDVGVWSFDVHGAKADPACHNCDAALSVHEDTPASSVGCSRCGLEHAVLEPPDWLAVRDPNVRKVVGTLPSVEPVTPEACPHCNTAVHPETRAVIPRCGSCGRDVVGPGAPSLPRSWGVLRSTQSSSKP